MVSVMPVDSSAVGKLTLTRGLQLGMVALVIGRQEWKLREVSKYPLDRQCCSWPGWYKKEVQDESVGWKRHKENEKNLKELLAVIQMITPFADMRAN